MQDTFFSRPDRVLVHHHGEASRADLYVCTVVSNHMRFRTRWKLYGDFAKMVKEAGAKLCVIEVAFGQRAWVLSPEREPVPDVLVSVRIQDEYWMKECALKILTQHLPHVAQYVAYVDADGRFARDDWANETLQQLQHYPVIQMWSHMIDLDSNHAPLTQINSFMYNWHAGSMDVTTPPAGYHGAPGHKRGYPGAPGLAWAWRIEALRAAGGLIDWGIFGAGDSYMAYALIGALTHTLWRKFHPGYTTPMFEWQQRADEAIGGNVGVMDGLMLHYFHGDKVKRQYGTRENNLVETQFNPATDLIRDPWGMYQLVIKNQRQRDLRLRLQRYFRQRSEDALSS